MLFSKETAEMSFFGNEDLARARNMGANGNDDKMCIEMDRINTMKIC